MSPGEAIIEVRNLHRRFGEIFALKGVDLAIDRGELFGVFGPDGAGKTTLMQSICAILDPTEGSVTVQGYDSVKGAKAITSRIGYMSQAYSLYWDLTVEENLEFFAGIRKIPRDIYRERREKLLAFSRLSQFLNRRVKHLSGGMQKKLALCTNLVHEPDILILDEHSLGVDPLSRRHLWRMIKEYHSEGKTVVLTTSYMDEVAGCERLAFLLDGKVLLVDKPDVIGDLEAVFATHIKKVERKRALPFEARATGGEAVRVSGLTKNFNGFRAVDEISFSIARGEVFGFVGPNGSGKTTTIKMLCGIIPPSAGEIDVVGINVLKKPDTVKGRVGYMSQRFSLYPDLTVEENIDFFGRVYGLDWDILAERKTWILEMTGLTAEEKRLTGNLSGAVKQRLALGCSLVHYPDVLFLDEPTSGVDPVSRKNFWEMITALAGAGTTVFVTTHYLAEAENCHRVAFMHQGRILSIDSPQNLRAMYRTDSLEDIFIELMEKKV